MLNDEIIQNKRIIVNYKLRFVLRNQKLSFYSSMLVVITIKFTALYPFLAEYENIAQNAKHEQTSGLVSKLVSLSFNRDKLLSV